MAISIDNVDLWNEATPVWANFIRSQKDFYGMYLNTPVTFGLMGDLLWKRVLDLGCGEGLNARLMTKKGAKVVGLEPSELYEHAVAAEKKTNLGIQFHRGRAEAMENLRLGQFDMVVAFMVLHEIKDLRATIKAVSETIEKHGEFIFSILHPVTNCCGDQWTSNGLPSGGKGDPDYFNRRQIKVRWESEHLIQPFETFHYHRPLSDYFDVLAGLGFSISKVVEPCPTDEQVKRFPPLAEQRGNPRFVHVKAEYLG